MAVAHDPPFRAEHIGSLLRPPELKQARADFEAGRISADDLHAAEDAHIIDVIRLQEEIGLNSISDGEFRRAIYFGHFPEAVSGFTYMESALEFHDEQGNPMTYTTPVVTGKIKRERGIATEDYKFIRAHTDRTPKVTLPSPCSQHYLRWRESVSDKAYPDVEDFFVDVAKAYREELRDLADLGAVNVQLDDVSLPLLCDDKLRAEFAERGYDPDDWVGKYIRLINAAIADRPAGLTVGMHLCRGNNQGKWLGEGGYDYIAEQLFNNLALDYLCMEYDSPRAGSFAPLRFMPNDKTVVLGLVSSKVPEMEDPDALKQRIEDASEYVDPDRLCLSPQCGFASTAPGNPITPAVQRAKLELVVNVAKDVWG